MDVSKKNKPEKAGQPFVFKQFEVLHHLCAHKVGFDGVLLGAWANFEGAKTVFDIGTGSGLIALMAAQKNSEAGINAIEIDMDSYNQAKENFKTSLWAKRFSLLHGDFMELETPVTFDHVITNPPFFINALKTPHKNRTTARHFTASQFKEFVAKTATLLNPGGRFSLIVPAEKEAELLLYLNYANYYLARKCRVFTKNAVKAERVLLECRLEKCDVEENTLFVYDENGKHSAEYCKLTSDFYPHF